MRFTTYERDGDVVLELDAEGIEYLADALEQMRHLEAGESLSTPMVVGGGEGQGDMEAMASYVLLRAADGDAED